MAKLPTIEINLDKKCKRCGEKGATKNGLCLECVTKALEQGEFDHVLDKFQEDDKRNSDCMDNHG